MVQKRHTSSSRTSTPIVKLEMDTAENEETKTAAEKQLEALQQQLDTKMASIREQREKLKERNENLLKRRQTIFDMGAEEGSAAKRQKTNESDSSSIAIDTDADADADADAADCQIKLNVGGTKMVLMRESLTSVKDSRLHFLFNGKMDGKLIRDGDGCVFMDLDPYYFRKVMEYIYITESHNGANEVKVLNDTKKEDIDQQTLNIYLDFFGLRNMSNEKQSNSTTGRDAGGSRSDSNENQEPSLVSGDQEKLLKSFESTLEKERLEISLKNKKLDEFEEKLEFDETFVKFFTKSSELHVTDKPVNLSLLDGDVVTVKPSLLQGSEVGTKLLDVDWTKKHTMKCSDGRSAIIVQYPSSAFKWVVNHLRLKAIAKAEVELPQLETNSAQDAHLKENVVAMLFPGKEEVVFGKSIRNSSTILTSFHEVCLIKGWLEEVNIRSMPKLLYRASVNGWNAKDFHSCCDSKGATLTIIKTSEGYIFGGYSDTSWGSYDEYFESLDAFLFSIKSDMESLPPQKMKIKPGSTSYAVYNNTSYGPIFGGGHDLCVGENGGNLKRGRHNIGDTYQLPPGVSNLFLNGGNYNFNVEELEVFAV